MRLECDVPYRPVSAVDIVEPNEITAEGELVFTASVVEAAIVLVSRA